MARISSAGTMIRIDDPDVPPLVGDITTLTKGKPCILTFSLSSTKPEIGDIIVPRDTGWVSLDGRPFRAMPNSANSVALEDSDTTGEMHPARTSASVPPSLFEIPLWLEFCRSTFTINGPASPTIDVTTLCDYEHKLLPALPAIGTWQANGFYDVQDRTVPIVRNAYRWGDRVLLDVRFNDDSGATFAATINTYDIAAGVNAAVTNNIGGNIDGPVAFYASSSSHGLSIAWPLNDPDLHCDFEFDEQNFYSGSLGVITADQALNCERPSTTGVDYCFDSNGLLVEIPINKPRFSDEGLWCETIQQPRLPFNDDLLNVVWVVDGVTVVRNLPSPLAKGTPAGWRLTATKDNATFKQTIGVIIPASTDNFLSSNAMMMLPTGVTLLGAVSMTTDNFVTSQDMRPGFVAGKWKYLTTDLVPLDGGSKTFGIRFAKAGDTIGLHLPNITRGQTVSTPAIRPGAGSVTRYDDMNRQRLENFPTLYDKPQFTVIIVVTPGMFPIIPVGSAAPNPVRRGWTSWEFNQAFHRQASGRGQIVNGVMQITAYTSGAYKANDVIEIGTGVLSNTIIQAPQISGTPGQIGNYNVSVMQTTFNTNIVINSRTYDAMGYGFNAATKPFDEEQPNAQRVGLTMTNEVALMSYGFDPQKNQYVYNKPNAEAVAVDQVARKGYIALAGDIEYTKDNLFKASVTIAPAGCEIMWGCFGFIGGNPINRTLQRGAIIMRKIADTEIIDITNKMQQAADAKVSMRLRREMQDVAVRSNQSRLARPWIQSEENDYA